MDFRLARQMLCSIEPWFAVFPQVLNFARAI
jgi:hypothetical protein